MKKLGAYIGNIFVEKNTFVWYEVINRLTPGINGGIYEVSIWSLKGGCPNGRKPDAKFNATNPRSIEDVIIPIKDVADKYCIEWHDQTWRIRECTVHYDYNYDFERVTNLEVERVVPNICHWSLEGEEGMSILKNAMVSKFLKKPKITFADLYPSSLTIPGTVGDMIKEELKKSIEQSTMKYTLNSFYGMGGFTTNPDPFKVVKMAEKETRTMEKKTMTETDSFLKNLNGITITSTYSKLDHGRGNLYYIYYPEMEITEEIADTLLTVLLMAKGEFVHKVVFNPGKGTTTIYKNKVESITVRCKDGEFDYILGYNMARTKMYLGSNDYNWFNKIKNHRKTHIEYTEKKPTEPKAKRTSKKGGKK